MSQAENSNLAIAIQNSYGGNAGAGFINPTSFYNVASLEHMAFIDNDMALQIPELIDESIVQRFDEGDSYGGPKQVGGTINFNAHPLDLGVLLTALCGVPTTTNATSAYTHVWEPRTADVFDQCAGNALTVQSRMDVGSAFLFYDCAAASIAMSIANGDFLKVALGVVGGTFIQLANVSPTYATGRRFKWDQTSVSINGGANGELRDLTVTLNENLEAQHMVIPSPFPGRIKRTARRSIEISGTISFDTQTEFEAFRDQSERDLDIMLTGTATYSGGPDSFRIQCPLLRYTDFPVSPTGAGPVEASFSAKAKYSTTSATSIRMTLVNTRASYYGS